MCESSKPTAAEWRAQLLALQPGVPWWLNGVPVTRIPCEGKFFMVGSHDEYPDGYYQKLRLSDAVERIRSGYYPRLPHGKSRMVYTCPSCQRTLAVGTAAGWCMSCVEMVCRDCWHDHSSGCGA